MYSPAAAPSADPTRGAGGFNIGFLFAQKDAELWPENWPVFELFASLATQWRVSDGARTGLDYPALYPLLNRLHDDPAEWRAAFDDVRVLEAAALQQMNENRAS